MLQKVDVRNAQRSLLTLTLEDSSNGYEVRDIGGLDPVNASISSSTFVGLAGEQYHSSRREKRNITMQLGFRPDYGTTTVASLRNNLYFYFMPDSVVDLIFYDDSGLTVKIQGRVESCEAPLFSKEPQVDISILCFDPDLLELNPELTTHLTTEDTTEILIPYAGTVNSPVHLSLNVEHDLSGFTVYHRPPDGTLHTIEFVVSLLTNDFVEIESSVGNKSVQLIRGGVETSILYAKTPQTPWLVFQRGDNYVRVYAEGDPIPYSLSYYNRYGGL